MMVRGLERNGKPKKPLLFSAQKRERKIRRCYKIGGRGRKAESAK